MSGSTLRPACAVDFVVTNTNATGPGSLAQAIVDANNLPGPDRVVFNIPGSGVRTIDVGGNFLPAITDAVTIDGYTQPGSSQNALATGSSAVVLIRIDGNNYNSGDANLSYSGITVSAPDCTIRGLMLTRFKPNVSGLGGGFRVGGFGIVSTGDRCVIEGNFIGTDGTSSTALGNGEAGVRISGLNYRVGGTSREARNMIGGNNIGIWATDSQGGTVGGNQIGRYVPAGGSGGQDGAANTIGVVVSGTFTNTVIGGGTIASRNIISSNQVGIRTAYTNPGSLTTSLGHGIRVQRNLIGADSGAAVGGNQIGIELLADQHLIGGTSPGSGNLIGWNAIGINFSNTSGSPTQNVVFGNDIQANSDKGLVVVGSDNQIGSVIAGTANHIHLNGTGIVVLGTPAQQNRILSNIIENNMTTPQIDLGGDGLTSNDFGDADNGPNRFQNFPVVTTSHNSAGDTVLTGELNSAPSSTFTVQLFGLLDGDTQQRLLNTLTVTTDANGVASFQTTYPGNVRAESVTATATDSLGNTSEMMPFNGPVQFANLSTRAFVGTGDNIMIGGFIVRSTSAKKLIVRALGPSLNFPDRLDDPYLEIYDSAGTLVAKNDDWRAGQQQEVMDSGVPPSNDLESAIVVSLPEGTYTALVRGAHNETGAGVVEFYDLGAWPADTGRLANISTRARVGLNDDALIGGFIVRGDAQVQTVVRAIGPDLAAAGVPGPLQDPTLELRSQNGTLVASNDDWRNGQQEQDIQNSGLAPNDDRDSAILAFLFPGNFTAIVRGKDAATGLALVEFYDLKQ